MGTNENDFRTVNDTSPFLLIHPGEILGDEIKARGFSQKEFAAQAGLQATHLSAIIHGTRNITPVVAEKLAAVLVGIPAETWLGLQNNYDRDKRRRVAKQHRPESYSSSLKSPGYVLAEQEVHYGKEFQVSLSVPLRDKDLLIHLSERMGWIINGQ